MNTEPQTSTAPDLSNTVLADAVFRPMLFSPPMVKALLAGSKTQTRRLVKENVPLGNWNDTLSKSLVKKGDIIWVRETFTKYINGEIHYRADSETENPFFKHWKPSLFMPKEACRIFLKVTDVKIERLNNISESDSIDEGIEKYHSYEGAKCKFKNYLKKDIFIGGDNAAIHSYRSLWEKINGKDSWLQNPFVWVYSFERVECPHGFR